MTKEMENVIIENCLKDARKAKKGNLNEGLPEIDNIITGCLNDLRILVNGAEKVFSSWNAYLSEKNRDQTFNFGDTIKIEGKEENLGGSSSSIRIDPMNFFKKRGITDKMLEGWFKEELEKTPGVEVVLSLSAQSEKSAGIKMEKKRDGNPKPWRCHFYFKGFKQSANTGR